MGRVRPPRAAGRSRRRRPCRAPRVDSRYGLSLISRMDSRTSSSTSVNARAAHGGRRPVACSTRSAKETSSVVCSPQSVWCTSTISRVPSRCWEMVSDRMVSSVMTPPALRMTCASPMSRPEQRRTAACGSPCTRRRRPRGPGAPACCPGTAAPTPRSPPASGRSRPRAPPSSVVCRRTLTARPRSRRSVRMGACAPSRNTRQWSPGCCRRCRRRRSPSPTAHGRVLARDVAARGRAARLRQLRDGRLRRPVGRGRRRPRERPGPAAGGRRHPGRAHRRRPPAPRAPCSGS